MNKELYVNILQKMIEIRVFEERVAKIAKNNEIQTPVHLYVGQEAIASTVCSVLNNDDYVVSTHRSHGHYIAKGGDLNKIMAEIYCRETGCSKGHGGSMHIIDRSVGYLGSSAIVAGSVSIAVGAAFTAKLKGTNQVSVAFFGDGATDEGVFYESLNFATLYKLPIIFVCENNGFSTHLPGFTRQSNPIVSERIKGFNINVEKVDGNNPLEILDSITKIVDIARKGDGPSLLECDTFRWLSHVGYWQDLDVGYRKKKDVEMWMDRCPIKFFSNVLLEKNILTEKEINKMWTSIKDKIEDYVLFAKKSPLPNPVNLFDGLYS